MIFDRTENDVRIAISLRQKIQSGDTMTSSETEQIERGTLTINTLNRIESKIYELVFLLKDAGYYGPESPLVEWSYQDYFKQSDFNQILAKINNLRKSFYVYMKTPETPGNNYRQFQTINDVEEILHDLEAMVEDIKSNYRQCGTFECGEE